MSTLSQSYGRCLLNADFLDRFYDGFISASPEIADRFAQTDMNRQKTMMRISLSMLVMFDDGKPIARPALEQLRSSHGPGRLQIPRHHYGLWLDCLLQAIRASDPKLTPELEERWKAAMQKGIDFMAS